ncbi:hypothetical protein MJO29_009457 [Puccinia striiformis f. sp. tritici]|uniref:uncharacterized protein n=1 Tax=Puccinia striiformis f. sp. tritici TaxID=168172 RepID=UPI0020072BA4|nr:uncharacterized protein Pst134EA_032477 [Puccinia striiformis f. sp. tritici]KAH9440706.1 hypothetical protein Pst134EA_032477 [Puccinia striiformis f. sp. tritici]KAI7950783.1 hypothetical protein MJO29_009457 [Puccinia striiformis f. sp. tritici]
MSYNNIGLTTPRGSGTSGYVQKNLSQPRQQDHHHHHNRNSDSHSYHQHEQQAKPDQSILDHQRKRRIENKCLELQVELEEQQELSEDQIESQVDSLRQKLLKDDDRLLTHTNGPLKPHESHEIAELKIKENEKFRNALQVSKNYKEGQSFDKEFQAQKKLKSIEDRNQARESLRSGTSNHRERVTHKPYDKHT